MHRSELKILAGAGSWGEQDGGWRKRKEGGRLEKDGEEARGRRKGKGGGGGRGGAGAQAAPVFLSVLMTQMCSCGDGCLGKLQIPWPLAAPPLGQGEVGGRTGGRKGERQGGREA